MEIIILFIICICLVIGFLLYMYKEASANRVLHQELEFENLPISFGDVNIFFISDIHRRNVSETIIREVKAMGKVDLVIIGGDLTEKGVPFDRVRKNLELLKELGPVFFVWGNNDYEVDIHYLDALLLDQGITVLANSSVTFESTEGDLIYLIGIDDVGKERHNLNQALHELNPGGFRILVSHNPYIKGKVKDEYGISLLLSGHTHGGQIHILGYSPYKKGSLTREGNLTTLISNGYGTTGVPLRLGAKAETHFLTLKHKVVK
jgi:uncharacterized protein